MIIIDDYEKLERKNTEPEGTREGNRRLSEQEIRRQREGDFAHEPSKELANETPEGPSSKVHTINFDLKPEELVAYLDQYMVKQDDAKAILATKICTHFNRIKMIKRFAEDQSDMVGGVKNNVLMMGPTGVGKTYMIKLIAKKIGVPFVKGDATKFSETGYVGGDVEDLVRDLVREADGDNELAQYGIVYIDEIDKIASSRNLIGADVSRTGVQRALLKPMEETDVELKVPHDPISMIQEIERFRKTGKREKRSINTKHVLFIMSGAFSDLTEIVRKRIVARGIGFGATVKKADKDAEILSLAKSEDLIEYGFESEFVGRLPVRAVFERLGQQDLYHILKGPNNPIILGKKLDFAAYGIDIKFDAPALELLAKEAFEENTGARGLVSAIERKMLPLEKTLPSTDVKKVAITEAVVKNPRKALADIVEGHGGNEALREFERLARDEKESIKQYVQENKKLFSDKYGLTLTPSRIDVVANFYSNNVLDVGSAIRRIKSYYDEIKKIELFFFKNHDINIVLEEDAVDFIIEQFTTSSVGIDDFFKQLSKDFELGLKLVRDKTGKHRFFITKKALLDPEAFLGDLIKNELSINDK